MHLEIKKILRDRCMEFHAASVDRYLNGLAVVCFMDDFPHDSVDVAATCFIFPVQANFLGMDA